MILMGLLSRMNDLSDEFEFAHVTVEPFCLIMTVVHCNY